MLGTSHSLLSSLARRLQAQQAGEYVTDLPPRVEKRLAAENG